MSSASRGSLGPTVSVAARGRCRLMRGRLGTGTEGVVGQEHGRRILAGGRRKSLPPHGRASSRAIQRLTDAGSIRGRRTTPGPGQRAPGRMRAEKSSARLANSPDGERVDIGTQLGERSYLHPSARSGDLARPDDRKRRSKRCFSPPTSRAASRCRRALARIAPGRNRTCDLALRRRALYPLSYRRGAS